ncbi:MAG: substrate-binding domain-containing protein [Candidatus Bipolaricaulia bacterium]
MNLLRKTSSVKLVVLVLAGLLVFGVALTSLGQESELPTVEQHVLKDPNVSDDLYVFVTAWRNLEFFDVHIEAFKLAGKVLNVKTKVMGPSGYNTQKEISAVRSAIGMQPEGIIIYPPDPSLKTVINEAEAAGIPVVTVTGDVPTSNRTAYVGIDQHRVGVVGGNYLAEITEGKVQVGLLSITSPMFQKRAQGYRDTFKKYDRIEIITKGDTQGNFQKGISVAKSILTSHPDLDAFVCVDSVGARSAVTALKEKGMLDQVNVIGMDRNNATVKSVGAGRLAASVAQKGHLSTFYAMQILYNLQHNPMPITTNNKKAGVKSAPIKINTGVDLVTQDNWKYWLRQNEGWKYWQEEE